MGCIAELLALPVCTAVSTHGAAHNSLCTYDCHALLHAHILLWLLVIVTLSSGSQGLHTAMAGTLHVLQKSTAYTMDNTKRTCNMCMHSAAHHSTLDGLLSSQLLFQTRLVYTYTTNAYTNLQGLLLKSYARRTDAGNTRLSCIHSDQPTLMLMLCCCSWFEKLIVLGPTEIEACVRSPWQWCAAYLPPD